MALVVEIAPYWSCACVRVKKWLDNADLRREWGRSLMPDCFGAGSWRLGHSCICTHLALGGYPQSGCNYSTFLFLAKCFCFQSRLLATVLKETAIFLLCETPR